MSPEESTRPTSTRVMVARLAEQVVGADPGVGADGEGGRWVTHDGDREITGIVVAAGGGGRVDVGLHLVAYMPPRPLGEQATVLRGALTAAADRAGLTGSLGEIDVTIHDLVAPEQIPGLGPPKIGGVEV